MLLVIFDTNALLDLYMIHPLALEEIISKFEKEKAMFWLPEQVYWEFNNHSKKKRECALNVIKNASTSARDKIAQTSDQIKKELLYLKNNAILADEKIISEIEEKLNEIRYQIKDELEALNTEYKKRMGIISESQDVIDMFVNQIHKANPPYLLTEVQRIELYEEGELRSKYNIPPGLTDIDKEDSNKAVIYRRRYGDFLIWKDVLRKTTELVHTLKDEDKLCVIFVENEKKGDWWIKRGEPTIAPELKEEFDSIAKGKAEFEMMNFTDFLTKYCNKFRIGTTTVESLVAKNKYKENVICDILSNAEEILKKELLEYYSSSTKYEHLFNSKSYFGGVFNSVKECKLDVKKVENISIEEDEVLRLFARIEFDSSGEVTEYINSKQTETGVVRNTHTVVMKVELSIDYSQGYDNSHYDTGKVYIQGFQKLKGHNIKALKNQVFERDSYTCQMCGKSIYEGALLCIDHIVPWSLGGTNDLDNLQTLCVECNNIKENSIT